MALRNWWIECEIDGRKTKLTGGPRAKDGGFKLTIRQRNKGQSVVAAHVRGFVHANGKLYLQVETEAGDGYNTSEFMTDR